MAVDLRCPNCDENLGKDTENPKSAYCSTCGKSGIDNPRGYSDLGDYEEHITNGPFYTRREAITEANICTKETNEQHDAVKISDGEWYTYNVVSYKAQKG